MTIETRTDWDAVLDKLYKVKHLLDKEGERAEGLSKLSSIISYMEQQQRFAKTALVCPSCAGSLYWPDA